jgi:hypothetical protein
MEVGLEREGTPTVHGGCVEGFTNCVSESEVGNDWGRKRVQFDGLLERIDRLRQPATGRLPEHTKPMECGRIAGIELDRTAVALLGRAEILVEAVVHGGERRVCLCQPIIEL